MNDEIRDEIFLSFLRGRLYAAAFTALGDKLEYRDGIDQVKSIWKLPVGLREPGRGNAPS
jgi:hypothetical protein